MAMLSLAAISILIGALLGSRFRIFVLFPATFVSFVAGVIAAVSGGGSWVALLGEVLITITGLQIGFLAGMALRFHVAAPPGTDQNAVSAAPTPPRQPLAPRANGSIPN
jgi:hypothetical protein